MNRRNFLGSVVAIGGTALTGCLGETAATSLKQASESAVKMTATKETAAESVYEGSGHLEEGEFAGMNFWAKMGFTFEWTLDVTKGGPLDVWVMEQKELKPFRNQGDASYFQGVSESGVKSTKVSGPMQPGKHMIIWENSGAYETATKGAVDFDATVRMSFE